MTIIDGIEKFKIENDLGSITIGISNIENLKVIIEKYLSTTNERDSRIVKSWEHNLRNNKELASIRAVYISGNYILLTITKRKDILESWSKRAVGFVNDYELFGAIPLERKPKRKLEL